MMASTSPSAGETPEDPTSSAVLSMIDAAAAASPAAVEEEPTACQKECTSQQKALVLCVDSIRSARLADASDVHGEGDNQDSSSTPECLPMAIAAWTTCCQEANDRERELKAKDKTS